MKKFKRTFGFIFSHPLSSRHPFKSLFRFILWQLGSSLSPSKLFVKRFIGPVKFYARKGLAGVTGNIYVGLHEFNDMGFLLHFLRPGDVFFDVGSNVGSFTLLASGVCQVKSFTIVPVSSTFVLLNKNIELNSLQDKVTTINAAAGAAAGMITFTASEDTTNHAILNADANTSSSIEVPLITIDSISNQNQPALMKIDVEGFETEVLKGMTNTLDQTVLKAIIIELNGDGAYYGYDEKEVHELLLSKEFRPYTYDPFKRSLTELATFGRENNTIYCRDEIFVNERLQLAPGFQIMGEVI